MAKLAWVLALSLLVAVPASAQAPEGVLDAPLRGFGPADLRAIAPLLEQGVVGMIEHDRFGPFPAAHYAALVDAPPERVFELLSQPERFPELMPALSTMRVVERSGRSTALEWSWRTSVFALRGHATMTLYAPAQRARGYRVVVERTDGDLGRGREVWRVLPRGAGSLVTLSMRTNLDDANYMTRQMRSQSLSRSVSATLGLGMLLRTRAEAERRAGRAPRQVAPGLRPPTIGSVAAIDPILRRGDLVILDANGTDLGQASFISVHGWPEDQIRSILRHPVAFASALVGSSEATLSSEHTEDGLRFDWRIRFALGGMGGTMTLCEEEDGTLALEAVDGTLQGGAWRFRTRPLPNHETVITGWARFDPAGAHPLLGAIVDADPSFRAGLAASAHAAFVRAMRSRLLRMPYGELLPPP